MKTSIAAVLVCAALAHGDVNECVALPPFSVQLVGTINPPALPAGTEFGGGGNVFERRVDVSGSLAVVGAGRYRVGAPGGTAYVYDFSDPNNIVLKHALRASDNSAGNEFGDGVAISGNYVFVGARGADSDAGAVYMYDVSDPNNVVERKITAFDSSPFSSFGYSLSVDGNRLLVGAPKFTVAATPDPAAYVIDFSDPDNLTQTKLLSPFPSSGLSNGGFAQAVSLSGNYAIINRPSDSSAFPFAGSAYLYDISNLGSIQHRRLTPTDAPNYSSFGGRVSISGTTAVVEVRSDPGPTNNGGSDGAVWAFDFSDWNNIKQREYGRVLPAFGGNVPPFGRWLELQGDLAIAAAFNEGDAAQGAIYFHDVSNVLAPTQLLRLPAPNADDLGFGIAMAMDGHSLVVSDRTGGVYLYRVIPEPSTAVLLTVALAGAGFRRRRLL